MTRIIKKTALIVACELILTPLTGQTQNKYSRLVKDALILYESQAYLKSALKYSEAFKKYNEDVIITDRYIAACSWALANQKDSSFNQLFKLVKGSNFIFEDYVTSNPDLVSLHSDKRWKEVTDLIESKEDDSQILDKTLGAAFNAIYFQDVKYRRQVKQIESQFGVQSDTAKAYWKMIKESDSITLTKVKEVLDTRGWLGSDVIGVLGNRTLFLSIQHSDLKTQEKYLPVMKDAVQKGNASASNFAYLVDRVAISQGKRQIYGSQLARDQETGAYYLLPLEDPDNIDVRRNEVGLGKLQDYISHLGMTWNPKEYKKQLPLIEEKIKNKLQ